MLSTLLVRALWGMLGQGHVLPEALQQALQTPGVVEERLVPWLTTHLPMVMALQDGNNGPGSGPGQEILHAAGLAGQCDGMQHGGASSGLLHGAGILQREPTEQ